MFTVDVESSESIDKTDSSPLKDKDDGYISIRVKKDQLDDEDLDRFCQTKLTDDEILRASIGDLTWDERQKRKVLKHRLDQKKYHQKKIIEEGQAYQDYCNEKSRVSKRKKSLNSSGASSNSPQLSQPVQAADTQSTPQGTPAPKHARRARSASVATPGATPTSRGSSRAQSTPRPRGRPRKIPTDSIDTTQEATGDAQEATDTVAHTTELSDLSFSNTVASREMSFEESTQDISETEVPCKTERDKIRKRKQRENLDERLKSQVKLYDQSKASRYRLQKQLSETYKRAANTSRQSEFRLRQSIPSSPNKYKVVLDNFLKAGMTSPRKREIIATSLAKVKVEQVRETNPIMQLKALQSQNRIPELLAFVDKLVSEHGSKRKVAAFYNIRWPTFLELCRPGKKDMTPRSVKAKETKESIGEFYDLADVSTSVPSGRHANKKFLVRTLQESYTLYVEWCKNEGKNAMSFSTFTKCRPSCVKTVGDTPNAECMCEKCLNAKLLSMAIVKSKIKGIKNSTTDSVKRTLCPVEATDVGVNPELGRYKCIIRKCKQCGTDRYLESLLEMNEGLEEDRTIVSWKRWEKVEKNGFKKLDIVFQSGTKYDLLKLYIEDIKTMAIHLFDKHWQYWQFRFIKANLPDGVLLQVLDFAQNYMNKYQNEPQSVHWHHQQTTIHPLVNYYKKNDALVTEEHIHVTSDLNHDKHAVNQFERKTLQHLQSQGFKPKQIIQFCDNCSSQYKSKGPFQFISESHIPIIRCFFGSRHGKGPADGVTGRAKKAITTAVKSGEVILRDAKEVHEFLHSYFTGQRSKKPSDRFKQESMFTEKINRSKQIYAEGIDGTQKLHSVRSTGEKGIIQGRKVTCLCLSCLGFEDTQCPNSKYADEWQAFNICKGGSKVKDFGVNNHWSNQTPNSEQPDTNDSIENVDIDLEATDDQLPDALIDDPDVDRFDVLYDRMQYCNNFNQLEALLVSEVDDSYTRPIENEVVRASRYDQIDEVAISEYPPDAPRDHIPIWTQGDGDCCPRSVSKAIFGDDSFYKELRIRIVIEGVLNKHRYLDHEYLKRGAKRIYGHATFPLVYAQFVAQDVDFSVPIDITQEERMELMNDMATEIYQEEMFKQRRAGTDVGIWQLFQAANVIARPIQIVFPIRGSEDFRNDFNRVVYPWDETLEGREPLKLMWTPINTGGAVNHFVPLLKL